VKDRPPNSFQLSVKEETTLWQVEPSGLFLWIRNLW
jgi:hypothetical protein